MKCNKCEYAGIMVMCDCCPKAVHEVEIPKGYGNAGIHYCYKCHEATQWVCNCVIKWCSKCNLKLELGYDTDRLEPSNKIDCRLCVHRLGCPYKGNRKKQCKHYLHEEEENGVGKQ